MDRTSQSTELDCGSESTDVGSGKSVHLRLLQLFGRRIRENSLSLSIAILPLPLRAFSSTLWVFNSERATEREFDFIRNRCLVKVSGSGDRFRGRRAWLKASGGEELTGRSGIELQYGAPGLTPTMKDPVLVFGSFSESEAYYFQSSPSVANGPQEVGVLSSPQHNGGSQELKGQSGPVVSQLSSVQSLAEVRQKGLQDGAQESSNSVSHPQAHDKVETSIFSITPADSGGEVAVPSFDSLPKNTITPPTGTMKTDGAGAGETGLEWAVKSLGLESNNGFEKVNGFGRDRHAGSVERPLKQLPPKSWASLVGVQAVGNDAGRSSGQSKALAAAVSKPTESISGFQPRGLLNTGNSCFVNATLQALLSCPPFLQLLLSIRSRSVPQTGYPTLLAFANFVGQFEANYSQEQKDPKVGRRDDGTDGGKPFTPAMFDAVLRNFSPDQPSRMGRQRQEDAQEFLSHVMDRMHEELLWLEGTSVGVQNAVVDEDDWETVGPKNRTALTRTHMSIKSPLSDIFGGQLCSVVKAKGNKASATVQPFLVLHLDILPDAVHSLEDALRFFAAPESLEGYKAASSKASEVVSASKSIKIQSLPQVLILHLMRFSYGASGSGKLHKSVRFPPNLILGRELLASTTGAGSEARKYELVATITHHGKDPSGGHYTADCRQPDGRWVRFDDAQVSVVGPNRVLHDQAYVLFYKRMAN